MNHSTIFKNSKTALIGFDGFIDKIFKIKKTNKTFFDKSSEFGDYILEKRGNNFSLEIEEIITKIGGNGTILANGLSNLGIKSDLIASLGLPNVDSIFQNINSNCSLHSYASPGYAYAYEFDDSKIMLAENGALNSINWQSLKEIIGRDYLINLFENNDLYCLVNWSEIMGMTSIWEGILQEIIPKLSNSKDKIVFFDLADCSNRASNEIQNILSIISTFSKNVKVILSLNKNETEAVFKVIFPKENLVFEEKGKKIFNFLNIEKLVLHHSKESYCFCKNDGLIFANTFFQQKPLISTGAGDHFNAGFCASILQDYTNVEALQFANAAAGFYISTGESPNFNQVFQYIQNQ